MFTKRLKVALAIPFITAGFVMLYITILQPRSRDSFDSIIMRPYYDEPQELRDLEEAPPTWERRMPSAIVVGAGKCGTDALITYLNTSDAFAINTIHTGLLELNYFNRNFFKSTQWYLDNMPYTMAEQITIEKCAPYMWDPIVPERVYLTNPKMKLIWVLCDPVKRTLSLYSHINSYKLSDGSNPLPSFFDMIYINKTTRRLEDRTIPQIQQPFLETGKYVNFVRQWLEYFPIDQMVFVSGEQLITDPLPQVQKVTRFLGRENSVTSENIYYEGARGYYCFQKSGDRWCMDRSTKGRKHPEVSNEMLKALQNHYQPYNEKLKETIGVEFGWPTYFGQKH